MIMDYSVLLILFYIYSVNGNTNKGYMGCFKDSIFDRTLAEYSEDLSPNGFNYCTALCIRKGFRFAGTKYSYECHCDNTIRYKTKLNDSWCNYLCEGNDSEKCGGSNAISIYDTWVSSTTTTTRKTTATVTEPTPTTTFINTIDSDTSGSNITSSDINSVCATEKPCKYNGSCSDIDKSNYKCICTEQWTGMNCSQDPVTTTTTTLIYSTATEQPLKSTDNDNMNDNRNRSKTTLFLKEGLDEDKKSGINPLYLLIPCCVVLVMIAFIIGVIIYYRRWKSRGNNENEMVLQECESSGRTDNVVQEFNNITDENTATYQDLHASPIAEGYYFELNN